MNDKIVLKITSAICVLLPIFCLMFWLWMWDGDIHYGWLVLWIGCIVSNVLMVIWIWRRVKNE